MDQKRILVVEDQVVQRKNLVKMVQMSGRRDAYIVFEADGYSEAMEIALRESIDLFLLDIDINSEENGYELALDLRKLPKYKLTWMVFLTVRSDYERTAFKQVHCYDYLIKPYTKADLSALLETLLKASTAVEQQFITVGNDGTAVRFNLSELVYVEALGRKCNFFTTRGEVEMAYVTLKSVEALLAPYAQFMRCHRSYIVNTDFIKTFNSKAYRQKYLELYEVERPLPVSAGYKEQLVKFLSNK